MANNDEVKTALREHGAKHSLFYAAQMGMVELVADLIKEGADVNDKNNVSLKCARNRARLCCCAGASACGEVERGMEMGRTCMHALATHPLTPLPASERQNSPRLRRILR